MLRAVVVCFDTAWANNKLNISTNKLGSCFVHVARNAIGDSSLVYLHLAHGEAHICGVERDPGVTKWKLSFGRCCWIFQSNHKTFCVSPGRIGLREWYWLACSVWEPGCLFMHWGSEVSKLSATAAIYSLYTWLESSLQVGPGCTVSFFKLESGISCLQ